MRYLRRIFALMILVFQGACALEVTIISRVLYSDGLCRIPLTWMEILDGWVNVSFIPVGLVNTESVDRRWLEIIKRRPACHPDIVLFCDALWYRDFDPTRKLPKAHLAIAYSMIESSAIPNQWVNILNSRFDMVVVPDEWLVTVYERSGVHIPIFVLPLALDLSDHCHVEPRIEPHEIFTFGMSAGFFSKHKNHELLIDAFHQAFKNDPGVRLKLHGRWGDDIHLRSKIKKLGAHNIEIINRVFSRREMLEFYQSLDSYVLVSKGEGFSNTPREALALAIPCILSDNSAHQTICRSGLVYPVPARISEPAYYGGFGFPCGYFEGCSIPDVARALIDMRAAFDVHKRQALKAREWSMSYDMSRLKKMYRMLVRPERIQKAPQNRICDEGVFTQSEKLYRIYSKLSGK